MFLAQNLFEANEFPERIIRKLARDDYWQSIYCNLKNPFELFENKGDFTDLQLMFIAYLSFFNTINMDVSTGDISKLVWEKDVYQDAYMTYRRKKMYKEKPEEYNLNMPKKQNKLGLKPKDKWVFNKKGKSKWQTKEKNT